MQRESLLEGAEVHEPHTAHKTCLYFYRLRQSVHRRLSPLSFHSPDQLHPLFVSPAVMFRASACALRPNFATSLLCNNFYPLKSRAHVLQSLLLLIEMLMGLIAKTGAGVSRKSALYEARKHAPKRVGSLERSAGHPAGWWRSTTN